MKKILLSFFLLILIIATIIWFNLPKLTPYYTQLSKCLQKQMLAILATLDSLQENLKTWGRLEWETLELPDSHSK